MVQAVEEHGVERERGIGPLSNNHNVTDASQSPEDIVLAMSTATKQEVVVAAQCTVVTFQDAARLYIEEDTCIKTAVVPDTTINCRALRNIVKSFLYGSPQSKHRWNN